MSLTGSESIPSSPTGVGEVNITELNDGEHATWWVIYRFFDGNYLSVQKIDPVSLDLKTSPITILPKS